MAWKRQLTLDELNATSVNTMVAHLGIVYTRLEEGVLEAEMPVDARTHQPSGCCTAAPPRRWRKPWARWPGG
jgi:acyl-coenzyme A thioesterase PaaI-like protein